MERSVCAWIKRPNWSMLLGFVVSGLQNNMTLNAPSMTAGLAAANAGLLPLLVSLIQIHH